MLHNGGFFAINLQVKGAVGPKEANKVINTAVCGLPTASPLALTPVIRVQVVSRPKILHMDPKWLRF